MPLVVLTADRPAELRGIGANQAIDQIKLYGAAVRWFCECRPARGPAGRGPLLALAGLPGLGARRGSRRRPARPGSPQPAVPRAAGARTGTSEWPESLDGRPGGQPWTRFPDHGRDAMTQLDLPWTERGVVVCGDGDYDARALVELAGRAGWPVLAEPRPAPAAAPPRCPPTSTCWRRRSSSGRTSPT